jgi:hypothetical protein
MKWVRPRCQEAPSNPAAIAAVRPWWASLVTSRTPDRPRATRPPRNPVQTAPSSALPAPARAAPGGRRRSRRWPPAPRGCTPPPFADLHRPRVDPTTPTGRRPAAGCATPRPPRRAQPRSATPGCWRSLQPIERATSSTRRVDPPPQSTAAPPRPVPARPAGAAPAGSGRSCPGAAEELKLHRADPGVPVAGPGAVAVGHPLGVRWPCSAPIWAATSTSSAPGRACPRPRPGRRHRRCRPCPATPTAPSWTRPPCSCSSGSSEPSRRG